MDPEELKAMVKAIRKIELALGSEIKIPSDSEKKNIEIGRKSIVASIPIKNGDILTETKPNSETAWKRIKSNAMG